MAAVVRNRFYPIIACALAVFVIVGFSRTYYLRFLSDLPPMRTLVHLHGLVFTAWLAVFIAQTRLVAAHRVDLHRKLGIAAVVIAALVFSVGVLTVFSNSVIPRVRPSGLSPAASTIVPLTSISLFAIFIALGVAFRRRTALHKRFMVLAMIAVISPATSRLLTLLGLRDYSMYLIPLVITLFVAWCVVHDWRHHRIVHPAFAIGGVVIVASWPLRLMIGYSDWWQSVSQVIARIGAHL